MATKRAKVNKTLEKAKKLVSKKGKNKTKKGTWPEGQARPQSKAYDIENDKTVPAKRTGYRFTKEGAKKLGKQPNDRPTAEEIEKYRNQTFKVKGKVNKSGPKGVGDGSFRYLYIESRADKSDLNKARKLELGGYNPDEMLELKIFVDVYEDDYEQGEGKNVNSYEVNWLKDPQVLAKDVVKYLSEELYLSENPNDYAIDDDGNIHTDQLQDEDGIHVNDKATLERWKKGEEKLYNAHYYIRPLAVKNRRPSVKELSQATGIGTYAKGGEMAKGGVVFDPKEVRDFQEHVFYYYGKNGALVSELEEGVPATTGEVLKAVSQYLAFLNKVNQNFNGFYGSMHRHVVHDIIEYNRNPKTNNYYYERVIDDMKKTPILEYGGILQPMIGGVNADPRFDIYNTTMFAEKGAEVPEGDEYGKGGETKIYEVATRTKGKSGEFASSVRAKSKEDALRIYKEKHGDDKNKVIVDVYETTRKRLEDGGEMAKGGALDWSNDENEALGNWLMKTKDGQSILAKSKNAIELEKNVREYAKKHDGVADLEIDDEDEGLDWVTFDDLMREIKSRYAKGGKTHEQGYDDREDESLAMRHGKIASKDFVGSHKRREHSRRDDARFETRNK